MKTIDRIILFLICIAMMTACAWVVGTFVLSAWAGEWVVTGPAWYLLVGVPGGWMWFHDSVQPELEWSTAWQKIHESGWGQ